MRVCVLARDTLHVTMAWHTVMAIADDHRLPVRCDRHSGRPMGRDHRRLRARPSGRGQCQDTWMRATGPLYRLLSMACVPTWASAGIWTIGHAYASCLDPNWLHA